MATKRKTTTKGVATRSIRTMKPANDITEMKRSFPKPSTPILRNSFQTTPLMNSSRLHQRQITIPMNNTTKKVSEKLKNTQH